MTAGRAVKQLDGPTYVRMGGLTVDWTWQSNGGWTVGRTEGRTDGRTCGWADGRADCRQAVCRAVGRSIVRDRWTDGWAVGHSVVRTVGRTFGTASQRLQGNIKNMEVVEDLESRPHKAVTFLVDRDKEIQEVREMRVPKASPAKSFAEKLRRRSKAE